MTIIHSRFQRARYSIRQDFGSFVSFANESDKNLRRLDEAPYRQLLDMARRSGPALPEQRPQLVVPPEDHLALFPWQLMGPFLNQGIPLTGLFPPAAPYWPRYMKVYRGVELSMAYQQMQDEVRSALAVQDGETVLDIGCGLMATLLPVAREKKCRIIGIDSTAEALQAASQRMELEGITSVDLFWVDALRYLQAIPDESVDKVALANALYVMRETVPVLRHIYRVLKRGRPLVAADPLPTFNPRAVLWENLRTHWREPRWADAVRLIARDLWVGFQILRHNKPLIQQAARNGRSIESTTLLLDRLGFADIQAGLTYAKQAGLYRAYKPVKDQ